MKLKDKKTFWPYGILLAIFLVFCACIYTVILSLDYPVHLDNFYLDKYQDVENNYNEIQLKQAKFEQDFKFDTNATILVNGVINKNEPEKIRHKKLIEVVNLNEPLNLIFDTNATKLDGNILLTRPDTNFENKKLNFILKDGKLEIANFSIPKPGRWQIMMKLASTDGAVGFYKFELYAK